MAPDNNTRHHSPKIRVHGNGSDKPILRDNRYSSGNRRRILPERRQERSGCHNPEVRKGSGAVLFALGVFTAVCGVVMTVLSATDSSVENKYPSSFSYVGPVVIFLAVVQLFAGIVLMNDTVSKTLLNCFSLDDPDSFCRVQCPKLSHFLRPDDNIVINRAAMNALKSEPGKSVLKRHAMNPNPIEGNNSAKSPSEENAPSSPQAVSVDIDQDTFSEDVTFNQNPQKNGGRGVRFSDGHAEDGGRPRTASTTSSDNGSLLSLRHCKVHPKAGIWWTDNPVEAFSQQSQAPVRQGTTEL